MVSRTLGNASIGLQLHLIILVAYSVYFVNFINGFICCYTPKRMKKYGTHPCLLLFFNNGFKIIQEPLQLRRFFPFITE